MKAEAQEQLAGRRARVLALLREEQSGARKAPTALLTTALPNVRYLSGFTGSNAALLMTNERALLFTDPRYALQAPQETDCEVKVVRGPLLPTVATWFGALQLTAVAIERNRISYSEFQQLAETQEAAKRANGKGSARVALRPVDDVVERVRSVKDAGEIEAIRRSVQLNSTALEAALRTLKPGRTRERELAAEIEYRMRRLGAESASFATIVASGPRTALPHAHPTDDVIAGDDLLLVDMGATVAGYASDMTRTFATGDLRGRHRQMYKAVLQSQLAAVDAIRPGVLSAAVDRAARRVLREYGWEKLFIHSTGHGLGLEIHERPRVGRKDRTKLEAGMVITVEPGIYIEGFGGIRIEDTVLVTATGADVLTPTDKRWQVLA